MTAPATAEALNKAHDADGEGIQTVPSKLLVAEVDCGKGRLSRGPLGRAGTESIAKWRGVCRTRSNELDGRIAARCTSSICPFAK
jgi:hypothetical protein